MAPNLGRRQRLVLGSSTLEGAGETVEGESFGEISENKTWEDETDKRETGEVETREDKLLGWIFESKPGKAKLSKVKLGQAKLGQAKL